MRIPCPNWIVGLILRIAQRTPYFPLRHRDGTLFMERYWLLPKALLRMVHDEEGGGFHFKPVAWLPLAPRIHLIRSSDEDRHLHDHPFNYATWILAGGYWEVLPIGIDPDFKRDGTETVNYAWRPPGSVLFRRATSRHRLKVANVVGAVSLFVATKRVQPWGFYTRTGKIYWRHYNAATADPPERVVFFGSRK